MIQALKGKMMSHLLALLGVSFVLAVAPTRSQRAAAVRLLQLGSLAVLPTSCRAGQILFQPGPTLRGEVLLMTYAHRLLLAYKLSLLQIRGGMRDILDLLAHRLKRVLPLIYLETIAGKKWH